MSKIQPRSRTWYRSFHLDRDRTALQSRSDELSITILLVTCKAHPGPLGLPGSRSSRDRGNPCPCTSMKKTPNSLHSFDRGEQLGSERHRPHGGIVGGRRRGRVPRLRAGLGDDRRAPFTEWRLPGRGLPLVTGEGPASPLSSPAGFKPASAPMTQSPRCESSHRPRPDSPRPGATSAGADELLERPGGQGRETLDRAGRLDHFTNVEIASRIRPDPVRRDEVSGQDRT